MPNYEGQLRVLADKDAIRDLVYRYTFCIDTNRADEFLTLFTEDCVFDPGPSNGGPVRGRDALAELRSRSSLAVSSHHNGNVLITFDGPDVASVRTNLYAWHRLIGGGEPQVWGYYDDLVVRRPEGWLFAQRTIRVYGEQGFDAQWNPGERLVEA